MAQQQKPEVPLKLGRQFRSMKIDGYDPETRTVAMAISSDTPVERWYGSEILDHSPSAIRQSRLQGGMPLLFNHDSDKHLGVQTSFKIGTDGKLRTENRFGDNPLAKEKEGDVASGILKDVSIGYYVHKYEITEDDRGNRTYRAVDWEPLENSLVTVPADISVGVGRAASEEVPVECVFVERSADSTTQRDSADGDTDDDDDETADPDENPDTGTEDGRSQPNQGERSMATTAVVTDVAAQNKERIAALRQLRTQYPNHFSETDLLDAIANGTESRAVKDQIADKVIAAANRSNVRTAGDQVMTEMSQRERSRYSMVRVLRHAINQAKPGTFAVDAELGIERDVDQELRKRLATLGATGFGAGILMPTNLNVNVERAARAARFLGRDADAAMLTRVAQPMEAGSSSYGAATLETITESSVIELLRKRARVLQLGARLLGGLQGIVRFPRQNAASSASWLPEYSAVTATALGFDSIQVAPNRLAIQAIYTMELLAQTAVAIEDLVRADQAAVQALAIDYAFINGSGTSNTPLGLLNRSGLAAIVAGSTTRGAQGAGNLALTWYDILNFETTIAKADADVADMGWMFTPEVRGDLKATPKTLSGSTTVFLPVWPDSGRRDPNGIEEGPLGYKAGVTNQLPKNLGAGTNNHAAIFGDWSSALVCDWGVQEVVLDNITQAAQGAYVVTQNSLHDCNVRHLEKFAASVSILP